MKRKKSERNSGKNHTVGSVFDAWRFRHALVLIGLVAIVELSYVGSFQSGFVFDNEHVIQGDSRIQAATPTNLYLIFTKDYWYPNFVGAIYRPLTTLSFLIEYSIFGYGDNPAPYHWVNIGCHLLNAFLVYRLLLQLSVDFWIASGIAGLFAAHPITTEAVTNLVGRSDLFATGSVLIGFLLYLCGQQSAGHRRWILLSLMALTNAIGVLTKEIAVTLVGLLVWYEILYRWPSRQPSIGANLLQGLRSSTPTLMWLAPVVIGLFVIRYSLRVQQGPSLMLWIDNSLRATDFVSSRMTAIKIIGHYLWLLVFPIYLSCDYTFATLPNCSWHLTSIHDWKAIGALAVIGLLFSIAWKRFRAGSKLELFFLGWFFISLLPTSNLLFLIDSSMAERFLYLPLVGFLGFAVTLIHSWISKLHRRGLFWLLIPILILSILRTQQRNMDWESNLTLWASAVKVCPENARAMRLLAWELYQANIDEPNFDSLIAMEERVVQIVKDLPNEEGDLGAYFSLGKFLGMKADRLSVRDSQGFVILTDKTRPLYEASLSNLVRAYEIDTAIDEKRSRKLREFGFKSSSIQRSGTLEVYQGLAVAYGRLDRYEDAVRILRSLQSLNPQLPAVYELLPRYLVRTENPQEAVVVLAQAILLGYQNETTHQQLVSLYEKLNSDASSPWLEHGIQNKLDLENPWMQSQLRQAAAELIELALESKNSPLAEHIRQASPKGSTELDSTVKSFIP